MKRKKRRSPWTSVEICGPGMQQAAQNSKAKDDKMHILTICDDLEGYLAPSTPEIQRVRIPAAGGRGELLRRGAFSSSNDDDATVNPKPCDTQPVETGISPAAGVLGLDLTLSSEALKQPTQVFIEGFENLLEMKFGIMALRIRHGLDAWSLGSHMVNPFEILSFVAATSVLNRAYFKMWELIQTFELVPSVAKNQRFLSAHLCEGPGGFIEAVLEYRARSSIAEEDNPDICDAAHGEFHTGDSSTVVNGTEAAWNSGSDNPSTGPGTARLSSGSACAGRRTSNSVTPRAILCVKNLSSGRNLRATVCGNDRKRVHTVHASAKVEGIEPSRQPGPVFPSAVERPTAAEGNLTSMSECPQADKLLNSRSSSDSIALVNDSFEIMDGELDRADSSKGLDEIEPGCGILPYSPGASRIWRDPSSPNSSVVAVTGNNLADNSRNFRSGAKTPKQYRDLWFGLTLASAQPCAAGGSPPPMMETRKLNEKVAGNSQGYVYYGVDGSGDLTNPANVDAFVEYTLGRSEGQRMDLVTADGAFDVSEDFSSQEHSHLNLVFCEVVSALRLQAEGGSFVLKLFDCYTTSTLTILFILSSLYLNVEIVRLRTTRICNSERYVVAKGFFGLSPQLEETLLRLNVEWNMASERGHKVGVLLSRGFPEKLLQAVMESNAAISAVQIDGISRALQLAGSIGERLPSSDSFGRRKESVSMLRRKLQTHKRMQSNAIALCNELNIPCRSQFSVQ